MTSVNPAGPLEGIRVVEFAAIGPGPFCGMLLSDMGAKVLMINRPGGPAPFPVLARGKASLVLDLKSPQGIATARSALDKADVLIEGFRPGVMERLRLGPKDVMATNSGLVYGRMTGWGQDGPLAHSAGHDITYIAVTGALAALGPPDRPPPPPLNLVGDFGGGALYLAMGICAALFERTRSGRGQVIDAAIMDGTASLMAGLAAFHPAMPLLTRGRSMLGGASPTYRCYACADGKYVAVGPLEPQFFAEFLRILELDPDTVGNRDDERTWPRTIALLEDRFRTRSRDEWATRFADSDGCVSPVLTIEEAPQHPQMAARNVYIVHDGLVQPVPAPRFTRTPCQLSLRSPALGEGGQELLTEWGL
jgi:alpha-methylacyl-CoA racemase